MGERFWRVPQLLEHERYVEQGLVDVQQQQVADVRVEPVGGGRPLRGGAAVDVALGGEIEVAGGAGVLAGGERQRPAG